MKRQRYAEWAAETEGRTVSGQESRDRVFIENLTDGELREANTWTRFAADWQQRLIQQERERRGI